MKNVLIYGGTTEGRKIAEFLSQNNVKCLVCVATEYGEQVMTENPLLSVKVWRQTALQMSEFLSQNNFSAIIDATHPFAREVSKNIRESVCNSGKGIPLFRFERNTGTSTVNEQSHKSNLIEYFENSFECAERLRHTEGNILLTIGSKNLAVFCNDISVRQRIIARVLPGMESLKLCYDAGLKGRQIVAMQGPFSQKMNETMLEDFKISVIVTKESGKIGGVNEKITAAESKNVKCFIIKDPNSSTDKNHDSSNSSFFPNVVTSIEELTEKLCKIGIFVHKNQLSPMQNQKQEQDDSKKSNIYVTLAGIGMGNATTMTVAVQNAIQNADYIIGAERMLESACKINSHAKKIEAYLADDIIPFLREIDSSKNAKIVVLFSGDTGFFSGTQKFLEKLKELENVRVDIFPGISTISYFAAKLGISWQNLKIISMHGTKEEQWGADFENAICQNEGIFLLTSGWNDVVQIWTLINGRNLQYSLFCGHQLSYDDEKIVKITEENYNLMNKIGLYSLILLPNPREKNNE